MALSSFGISLFLLLGHLSQSFSQSSPNVSYKAAVVEFTPEQAANSGNVVKNLFALENLAAAAQKEKVNIIVFPEDAITGYNYSNRFAIYPYLEILPPTPRRGVTIIPCGESTYNDRFIFQRLSCIAKKYDMVLVANMGEKEVCKPDDRDCPDDGHYQYNVNVVFDEYGKFVAKYRKFNLYGPEKTFWDVPDIAEHVTFTTSFGVKFGVFTCFDILFKNPAFNMASKGEAANFIFTTAWGNQLPYFMSVAIQQAWSRRTGTTLLAANCHLPTYSSFPSTGSGIYSSGSAVSTFVSGQDFAPATGKLIVANMPPKRPYHQEVVKSDGVGTRRPKYMVITVLRGQSPAVARHTMQGVGTLTCSLEYQFKKRYEAETYGLGALIRHRNKEYTAVCTLFKCSDPFCLDTSFQPTTKASTIFSKISLSGDFPQRSVVFPVALLSGYQLLPAELLIFDGKKFTVENPKPSPLLSVSLWSILPDPSNPDFDPGNNLVMGVGEEMDTPTGNILE